MDAEDPAATPRTAEAAPREIYAPLLSEETLKLLETAAWAGRWPAQDLQLLVLKVCRAERGVHEAQVGGDPDVVRQAEWVRTESRANLRAEQHHLAHLGLCLFSHAIEFKGEELADLVEQAVATRPEALDAFAERLLSLPRTSAAMVPALHRLLKASVDWLRGEQADIAERLTNVETLLTQEAT